MLLVLAVAPACATTAPHDPVPPTPKPAVRPTGNVPPPMGSKALAVVADEESLEQQIAVYLRERGLRVQIQRRPGSQDAWVVLKFEGGAKPPYRFVVDTAISARDPGGKITERVVIVRLFTGVTVPPTALAAALQTVNKHHARIWAGTFYVNPRDGELEAQWPLNIPGRGVTIHPEQVYDAISRFSASWNDLFSALSPVLRGTI